MIVSTPLFGGWTSVFNAAVVDHADTAFGALLVLAMRYIRDVGGVGTVHQTLQMYPGADKAAADGVTGQSHHAGGKLDP